MLNIISKTHLILGLVFLMVFLLTGHYMDGVLNHLQGMSDGPRMVYRAGHIYILFISLMNILLGTQKHHEDHKLFASVQIAGALLIMIAPFLFTYGFFYEAPLGEVERPHTRNAIYSSLAGTLLIMVNKVLSNVIRKYI